MRDDEGKAYTVRYDAVNAMLLNEFLKEHKKVEEQGATIAQLKKQIDNLTAIVQKVSGARGKISRQQSWRPILKAVPELRRPTAELGSLTWAFDAAARWLGT